MFSRLSYRKKLLSGVLLTLLLCCGTATVVTFFLIEQRIYAIAHREMEFSAYGMHSMLQNMISISARAYLQGNAAVPVPSPVGAPAQHEPENSVRLSRGGSASTNSQDACGRAIVALGYNYFLQQADPYREIRSGDDQRCMTWTEIVGNERVRVRYLDSRHLPPLLELDHLDVALPSSSDSEDFFIIDRKTNHIVFAGKRRSDGDEPMEHRSGKSLKQIVLDDLAGRKDMQNGDGCCGSIKFIDTKLQHHQDAIYRHIPDFDWVLVVLTDLDYAEQPLSQLRWLMAGAIVLSLLLTALLLQKVLRNMTADLMSLLSYVEAVDGRSQHAMTIAPGNDEIGRLGQAFLLMEKRLLDYTGDLEHRVAERTQALEEANRTLAAQALRDPLTGLANRRYFDQRLTEESARANRGGPSFALLLIDVDHFKKYNDHYGHPAGDTCLQNIARALEAHVQRTNDFCARIGGEEFAILLPNTTQRDAQMLGETLCQRIAAAAWPHATAPKGKVTLSIGLATWETGMSPEDIYKRSDQALYHAKANGRDNCQAAAP